MLPRIFAVITTSLLCGLYLFLDPARSHAQEFGFYFEEDKKKTSLPFEIHSNLIIVPVTVNETYRLKFLLDTGVKNTILIDKALADSIGVSYKRSIRLYGAGDKSHVHALVTDDVSLELPAIKSNGLSSLVLEEDFLHLDRHLGTRVHGIIGYDIFSRFVVKIDYARQKITLYEPQEFKLRGRYNSIDLNIQDSKPISGLDVRLNPDTEIRAKLLIDTGASHALVLDQKSNNRIVLPSKHIRASLGRGLAGEINGYLGRISSLDFGGTQIPDVIASFPERVNFEEDGFYARNGSIGGELLKKFTIIFDYLHSKMYLKSNGSFKYPFEYNMSGLEIIAEGEKLNRFVISKIRNNSAAYLAGFESGDILVSLNNVLSKDLDLTKIYTHLNIREGEKISITVFRNGKYITGTFSLQREI